MPCSLETGELITSVFRVENYVKQETGRSGKLILPPMFADFLHSLLFNVPEIINENICKRNILFLATCKNIKGRHNSESQNLGKEPGVRNW
jgi:hypothetical protein